MENKTNTSQSSSGLTSVEMASLWNGYLIETMVHHMFKYFLQHVDDHEIKALVEISHSLSKKQMKMYESIFQKEKFPIPRGTQPEDINLNAPRLFSDIYYLNYIKNVAKFALITHTTAFTEVTRPDMKKHFGDMIDNLKEIEVKTTGLMLSKGVYTRPPYVPTPVGVDFVKSQKFLGTLFGSQRPLTVQEIAQLFTIAEGNALGKATSMAFSQVTQDKKIKAYFSKGKETANKNVELFNEMLLAEDLPTVKTYDCEVTGSTVSPFSDRLMLFQESIIATAGIGNYGMAIAQSQRKDLAVTYTRLFGEAMEYAEEGGKLLVENGWMEQPPLAIDREELLYEN